MSIILELTPRQAEIFEQVMERIDETAIFLAGLSHEERLGWLKEHRHRRPISFEREIDGTVYTVNAYFSSKCTETIAKKVERILGQDFIH